MASKSFSHDVIISGGGAPGLTLALLLAQAGLKIALIDPAPLSSFKVGAAEGRTSALMQSALHTLKKAKVWDECAKHGATLEILRIIDDSTGGKRQQIETDFPAQDIGLPYFGINMPNNILRAVLAQHAAKNKNITLCDALSLKDFTVDDFGVTATLSNGEHLRGRLLVGADGRHSLVREISGIKIWQHDYGQTAMTCLISHSGSHENISTEFHRPGGPFTLVPMPNKQSSVVWVEKSPDADEFMRINKQAFEQALQDRTCNRLGQIKLISNPQSCPLTALRANDLIAKRVALMAEAAHVLSPLGAQGLNLSLRDADCLAQTVIEAAQTGLDIGTQSVLKSYENQRRADVFLRSTGTDGLTRFVSHNIRPVHEIRRAGLRTLSIIEPLRLFAMQQGMAS